MCGMLIGVLMEKTRLANRIALFTISRVGTTPIRMYIAFLLGRIHRQRDHPDVITVDILFMAIATGMCQSLNLSVTSRFPRPPSVLAAFFGATISSAPTCPTTRASSACSWSRTWASRSHGWASTAKICLTRSGTRCWPIPSCTFSAGVSLASTFPAAALGAEAELATLGKMSRDEKKTLVLALLALVAFISEPWHGTPATSPSAAWSCLDSPLSST